MQQPLFQIEWLHVSVVLGMGQGLVNVKELHAFGAKIADERLQTGDVSEERWSGQTAEDNHRVLTFQLTQVEGLSIGGVAGRIR